MPRVLKFFKKIGFAVAAVILLAGILGPSAQAASGKSNRHVVVVLLDKVTWQEIADAKAPFLHNLTLNKTSFDNLKRGGAAGLMSNHTASNYTNAPRGYATIATGNRSLAPIETGVAVNGKEKFGDENGRVLYQRQTGLNPGKSQVFYLDLAGLQQANLGVGYTVKPGILGEAFHGAGLKTAVLGNADIDRKVSYERQAALIAMDENGAVDYGDVSRRLLMKDNYSPYGLRTNYDRLLRKFISLKDKAALTVIETGDGSRADSFQTVATAAVSRKYKEEAISRADDFLNSLYSKINPKNTTLMILSPSPPINESGDITQQLLPVIMAGAGVEPGFLTSGSTRRTALVTGTDIVPTILKIIGVPSPSYLAGQAMQSVPSSINKLDFLTKANAGYTLADSLAWPLIVFYVVLQIFALLVALLVLSAQVKITKPIFTAVSVMLLAALSLPLALFAAPLINFNQPASVAGYLFAIFFVLLLLVGLVRLSAEKKIRPLLSVSVVTVLFLLVNLFFSAESDLRSAFGYSPIVAGRFYGMGNQAMSVLIAAALVAAALFLEQIEQVTRPIKLGVAAFFLAVTVFIGFPALGANTGGTITACVAFAVAYIYMFHRHIKGRQIALVLAGTVLLVGLFIAADIYLLPVKTHMARAFESIANGGFSQFWQIAARKLSANVRIFKYTSWSYLFLTIFIILLFLRFFRPLDSGQQLLSRYKYLSAGLTGGLIGGVAGALTNDSGISIPAIILAYFLVVIFYLQIYDKKTEERASGSLTPERRDPQRPALDFSEGD